MTADTIHTLSASIPDDLLRETRPGGRAANVPGMGFDPDVYRFVSLYRMTDFGWKYASTAAHNNGRMHLQSSQLLGDDEVIFRAYLFVRFPKEFPYPDIKGALALTTPAMATTRILLQGLLLSRDASVLSVAQDSGLDLGVVLAFEKLFFNVLDRKNDVSYLQSIVYPHGRLVELTEGYLRTTPLGPMIMRAGYNNGAAHVKFMLGTSNSALDALLRSTDPKQLEQLMMTYGFILAHNGGINQTALPGIAHARHLLTASKLGGQDAESMPLDDDLAGTLKTEALRIGGPKIVVPVVK